MIKVMILILRSLAIIMMMMMNDDDDSRKLVDVGDVVNFVNNIINLDDNGDCVHLIHVQVLFKVLQIVSNIHTEVNVVLL